MESSEPSPVALSRRTLLGGVAGLAAGQALPSAAAAPPTLTVATRNLYLGVDLSRLFGASSMDDVRRLAGQMLDEVRTHPYGARMEAIADEVAATRPDVMGVQEAALIRVQAESDFDDDPSRNASTVVVDLLELLSSKLDARGLDYEVVASTVTTDVELPAADGDQQADVRLTDRTAVLVRGDVETEDSRSGTFDAALRYPLPGTLVSLRRGYSQVDVTVGSAGVTVVDAHLESSDADVRQEQARELVDSLSEDGPVVLAGDFNSGPGGHSAAYDHLTESLEDSHSIRGSDADLPTCCQDNDLRNEESSLSRRVDHVLYRGALQPTGIQRVGADPDSRVSADVDGESVSLWPSDHAGLVTTFEAPASTATSTASPTTTSAETATSSTTETTTTSTTGGSGAVNLPLYAALAGLGGLAIGAFSRYRRSE